MKHYKKIILTLVALLAVTAGAWADETPLVTIENKDYKSFKSGSMTFDDKVTITSSGTTVTFTRGTGDDSNKWTMDNGMPAGNVEVAPEYYPQATVATGGVTAATGVQATTDAELVTIDATKLTGATTLKYIVTTDATPAPAYDATGWTSDIPTAANITTVGLTYVWYYPVGTDDEDPAKTYSDGDICKEPISVSIQPAPTYAINLKEGTEDADKWTISQAEAIKGTTITATYTGTKKVIGMTVTKRVSLVYPIVISEVTDEAYIGSVVADDGYVYATVAAAKAASKTPVAMIAYVGTASNCTHGLAIALADESGTKDFWAAVTACSGKAAVTGGTWRLPSEKDWQYMFIGCGSSESYSAPTIGMSKSFSGLASKLTTAQGDALQTSTSYYWSSTKYSLSNAWLVFFDGSSAFFYGDYDDQEFSVRACLAF